MFDLTPVTDWLLQHGTRILIILLVGVGLRFALKRFLPSLVRRLVVKTRGESVQGSRKRASKNLKHKTGCRTISKNRRS